VRSRKASHLQGGVDRTGDPILTSEVFHVTHVTLSLKLGDHEGLALFAHGWLLKRTLLLVLPTILIQIPICAFLSPVPIYWGVQPGTCRCCPAAAGAPAPNSRKLSVGFEYFALFLLSLTLLALLVLLVKLFLYSICKSLFPFPPFSLPLVGVWGSTERIGHSAYWCPALKGDTNSFVKRRIRKGMKIVVIQVHCSLNISLYGQCD